jgi:hypothetical protein
MTSAKLFRPTLVLAVLPTAALAQDIDFQGMFWGVLGLLLLCGIGIYAATQAQEKAETRDNLDFATPDNIGAKLQLVMPVRPPFRLEVMRQSGNVQRELVCANYEALTNEIAATMRRAKIEAVSIRREGDEFVLMRTFHHGRGTQEGKRIGGFRVNAVG